jgi:hypothetical protein
MIPYAMQALNMRHKCGTKCSIPCCKSACTISAVPAVLNGLFVLNVHLIFDWLMTRLARFQSPLFVMRPQMPCSADPVHHMNHQSPLNQESELRTTPSVTPSQIEYTDIRYLNSANLVGRLFCHNPHEYGTPWYIIDLPAVLLPWGSLGISYLSQKVRVSFEVSHGPLLFTILNRLLLLALIPPSFLFHHGAILGERVVLAEQLGQKAKMTARCKRSIDRFSLSLFVRILRKIVSRFTFRLSLYDSRIVLLGSLNVNLFNVLWVIWKHIYPWSDKDDSSDTCRLLDFNFFLSPLHNYLHFTTKFILFITRHP